MIRGVAAGMFAGVPQVLVVQVLERVLRLERDRADIGPRFVGRLAAHMGESAPARVRWPLAALFHFVYAAGWGGLYGLVDRVARPPAALSASALAGMIYLLAFSTWGGGTQTGVEPHPDQRGPRDWLHVWSAPVSYCLALAVAYEWLRGLAGPVDAAVEPAREGVPTGSRAAW